MASDKQEETNNTTNCTIKQSANIKLTTVTNCAACKRDGEGASDSSSQNKNQMASREQMQSLIKKLRILREKQIYADKLRDRIRTMVSDQVSGDELEGGIQQLWIRVSELQLRSKELSNMAKEKALELTNISARVALEQGEYP